MLINIIAPIHRYLGETMLLIALIGVILAIVGLIRKKAWEKPERIFGMIYAGLLDLQALLGVIYYFLLPQPARPSLLHPIIMILAVIVVHAGRRWRDSPTPIRHRAQLAVYGFSLVLVFIGRMLVA